MTKDKDSCRFVSCRTLRLVVGILGVALPVILAIWGFFLFRCIEIRPSISDYYNFRTRDALVGILCAVGFYLFAYRGYERKDDLAGHLGCLFAVCVALFPCCGQKWQRVVHFISATLLFLVLSYFSIVLFTKTEGKPSRRKIARNRIYRTCGIVMLACILLIGIYSWWLKNTPVANLKPVFWLESLALWAFGISWFVKGKTLFQD